MSEVEEQEQQQRAEEVAEAERQMLDKLRDLQLSHVWKKLKVGLQCERFFQTTVGKELAKRLNEQVLDGQNSWLTCDDPGSPAARSWHLKARAAAEALRALDAILAESADAEKLFNDMEQADNDE